MNAKGKITGIYIDGKQIATAQKYELEAADYPLPEDVRCSFEIVDIHFYNEASDYFLKALMYALRFRN